MRDDDTPDGEEFDIESTMGKLLQSGIRPDRGQAEYALPLGEPALQGAIAEFGLTPPLTPPLAEPVSRRRFLHLGLATSIAGAAGWMLGAGGDRPLNTPGTRLPAHPKDVAPRELVLLAGVKSLAVGALDDLVYSFEVYVHFVERFGASEPVLWEGVGRLARVAMIDRTTKGERIARRLLVAFKISPPPTHLHALVVELEDTVHELDQEKR